MATKQEKVKAIMLRFLEQVDEENPREIMDFNLDNPEGLAVVMGSIERAARIAKRKLEKLV